MTQIHLSVRMVEQNAKLTNCFWSDACIYLFFFWWLLRCPWARTSPTPYPQLKGCSCLHTFFQSHISSRVSACVIRLLFIDVFNSLFETFWCHLTRDAHFAATKFVKMLLRREFWISSEILLTVAREKILHLLRQRLLTELTMQNVDVRYGLIGLVSSIHSFKKNFF